MKVRKIVDTDYKKVAQMMTKAYSVAPWNEKWTVEKALRRVSSIMSNYESMGLISLDESEVNEVFTGAILGFVDPYEDRDFFYVSELFVLPEYRNKGIGKSLMNELRKELIKDNIHFIQLISIDNNIEFYEKIGLKQDSVKVLYDKF